MEVAKARRLRVAVLEHAGQGEDEQADRDFLAYTGYRKHTGARLELGVEGIKADDGEGYYLPPDVRFADGRTGQSTVRRSFAALLHNSLGLRGIPRNPARPAYFANFGLSVEHDAVMTRWMIERLQIAVWAKPAVREFPLDAIESALIGQFQPPLNLQGASTPWTASVKAARQVMAAEARAWAESRQR